MACNEDTNSGIATFKDLKLEKWLLEQLEVFALNKPTPVQYNCIPPILEGRDCIGCDKTGSGKTLAFLLPILHFLGKDPYGIFALVLSPTRELASQIADQFAVIGKPIRLRTCLLLGGADMIKQGRLLSSRPHVVISTPGRIMALMTIYGNSLNFNKLRFLVIDEADSILGGSYDDQLKVIFKELPKKRQTLLFSATITKTLTAIRTVATNEPFFWEANKVAETVDQLDQRYVLTHPDFKDGYMIYVAYELLQTENRRYCIMIFTESCRSCLILSMMFQKLRIRCVAIHSLMSQHKRERSLALFKSSRVRILISTDVCSRGLDIPAVQLVINHNVPIVPKDYIHRVGRTARAGGGGQAITFITPHDIVLLHAIEDMIKTQLTIFKVNEWEVFEILKAVSIARRSCELEVDNSNFDEKRIIRKRIEMIVKGKDPDEEERKKAKLLKAQKKKMKNSACNVVVSAKRNRRFVKAKWREQARLKACDVTDKNPKKSQSPNVMKKKKKEFSKSKATKVSKSNGNKKRKTLKIAVNKSEMKVKKKKKKKASQSQQ